MLQGLREGTRGWIAWVIIAILIIPFALWGVGNYAGFISPSYVAEVNGTDITQSEFRRAYNTRLQRLRQIRGEDFQPDADSMKKRVLSSLIGQKLIQQQAVESGYRVGNDQLIAKIHSMPVFQVGKQFNVDVYRVRVQQSGYSLEGFENSMRRDLAVTQLRSGIAGSALVTDATYKHFVALAREKRKIAYATVSAKDYLGQARPTDAEVQAWYNNHQQAFKTPDKVTIAYVELDADDLKSNVKVTEAALRDLYQKKKATFVQQAQRRVAHILIAPQADNPDARQQAKTTAEEVLEKLRHGADFAKLAKQYSDDPGSAKKGGELGWISRGEMVKPFGTALFAMDDVGALKGPVKTKFGYHIIKLEGVRKPKQKPFSAVRDQLAATYRKQQARKKYSDLGGRLSNLAFDDSDSLQPIHDELGLPIEKVSDVTRDEGEGIASNPKVRAAAFSDAVYQNSKNQLVTVSDTHALVLRVVNREPSRLKPLKAVRGSVVQQLKMRAAAKKAANAAGSLAGDVKQGASLKAAAGQHADVTAPAWVSRNSRNIPGPILKAAFKAAKQDNVGVVSLGSGDQAVWVVSDVKAGDPATLSGAEKQRFESGIQRGRAQAALSAYVDDLRDKADISIEDKNIREY